MATTHYHELHGLHIADRVRAFVRNAKEDLRLNAEYKRTLAELRGLDDRDLADLGIARAGINALARESVYGS